jgi:serine/threonine-protein kinase
MAEPNWRVVEDLFFAAEELPAAERAAYLEHACAGDEELRARVEQLLSASEAVGTRFERLVGAAARDEVVEVAPRMPERLGPYRLLRDLGEGGMGAVYLAERADGEFRQRVAIKVVKAGRDSPNLRRRFRHERQVLAQLEHPAIARLLDGGTTPDGVPYLVMEYVEGERIDDFCDRRQLPVQGRLDLFAEVCAAVHHAHTHLVVHRDLKPSNILVTAAAGKTEPGQVKLLDFGIAKLLDEETEAEGLTVLGERPLTPEYASPEQVRDEPITTATDVYVLGLLLYRLLTGKAAYELTATTGPELVRSICESVTEPPSVAFRRLLAEDGEQAAAIAAARGMSAPRLARLLAGDLDHIVMKALRKEPQQRYGSAEQLALDLDRYRSGLPVEARRGGWRYRARRFVRRHRTGVVAAAVAVLALGIGLVAQRREALRANREAVRANLEMQRANREAAAATRVTDFLVGLFSVSDPGEARGRTVTAREILDRGVAQIDRELADDPRLRARLTDTMARVYKELGLLADAEPLQRRALALQRQVLGDEHADAVSSLVQWGELRREQGKLDEAIAAHEEALARRRRLFGERSLPVAEVQNDLALSLMNRGDTARAGELFQAALTTRRALQAPAETASTLHNLTILARRQGDYERGRQLGREALAIKQRLYPGDHPSTARTLGQLCNTVSDLGDEEEAIELCRSYVGMSERTLGRDHPQVASALNDLASVLHDQRRYAEAEPLYRRSMAIHVAANGEDSREVDVALNNLAWLLRDRGDLLGAEPLFRQSLQRRRLRWGPEHVDVARAEHNLASLDLELGKLGEAQALLDHALAVRRKLLPAQHQDVGLSLLLAADLELARGRVPAAVERARQGLAVLRAALPAGHVRIAQGELGLGRALLAAGRLDEAEPLLTNSETTLAAKAGADDPRTVKARAALAELRRLRAAATR